MSFSTPSFDRYGALPIIPTDKADLPECLQAGRVILERLKKKRLACRKGNFSRDVTERNALDEKIQKYTGWIEDVEKVLGTP